MGNKRKPDLLTVLTIVVALGVISSSVAQGMFSQATPQEQIAQNQTSVSQSR